MARSLATLATFTDRVFAASGLYAFYYGFRYAG